MSKIPSILPYPEILPINSVPELKDRLVYIIKEYNTSDGISILIFFNGKKLGIRVGDFLGNVIDPTDAKASKAIQYVNPLIDLVNKARIFQSQFYFSNNAGEFKLVDIKTHIDKMVGPGMLRDLCGKIIPTQDIVAVKKLDTDLIKELASYGNVILKHSSFKIMVREDKFLPLYARSYEKANQ